MSQHTAEKTNCRKIGDKKYNDSTNTAIYAYSETTFGGPTIGYVMTENRIYVCCRFCQDVPFVLFWDTWKKQLQI